MGTWSTWAQMCQMWAGHRTIIAAQVKRLFLISDILFHLETWAAERRVLSKTEAKSHFLPSLLQKLWETWRARCTSVLASPTTEPPVF